MNAEQGRGEAIPLLCGCESETSGNISYPYLLCKFWGMTGYLSIPFLIPICACGDLKIIIRANQPLENIQTNFHLKEP